MSPRQAELPPCCGHRPHCDEVLACKDRDAMLDNKMSEIRLGLLWSSAFLSNLGGGVVD